jgi:GTPase
VAEHPTAIPDPDGPVTETLREAIETLRTLATEMSADTTSVADTMDRTMLAMENDPRLVAECVVTSLAFVKASHEMIRRLCEVSDALTVAIDAVDRRLTRTHALAVQAWEATP